VTALLDDHDALGLAALVTAGEVTAAELVEAAVRRIEDANPRVNAVVATRFGEALADARRPTPGPFTGVPFLVKALGADVAGLPTTRGSRLFADDVPTRDSAAVARFRAAGLVVLGTTNTPELGKNGTTEPLLHGPTRNPWNPAHSAGGSSGGSAAAVATGMVPVAHGNDGGGSIRIPASACGLFGLKPSRGRVPNAPAADGFAYAFACQHALTRSVRDSAALLDAVAGPLPGDPYAAPAPVRPFLEEVGADPGRLRIGWTTTSARGLGADPECAAVTADAARLCEALGHHVDEVEFAYDADAFTAAQSVIMAANARAVIDRRLATLGRPLADDDVEPFTHVLYDMAGARTASELVIALETVERLGRQTAANFDGYDVLLTPTLLCRVPELGWADTTRPETMVHASAFTAFAGVFNATGQPAMSVPFGVDTAGLPLGVQFAAPFGAEAVLLRLAAQLEAAAPWPGRAPGA
jgi:amidase